MFGFLFKRKKSIDSRGKDSRGSGKSRKGDSNTLQPQSSLKSLLEQNSAAEDNDSNSNLCVPACISSPENQKCEKQEECLVGDVGPIEDIKYYSLTNLSKDVECINEGHAASHAVEFESDTEEKLGNQEKSHDKQILVDTGKRDLSEAERNAMVELDEIRSKILTKDTEISLLQADVNMLAADRDNKIVQIEDLTCQLRRIQEENETSLATVQSIEIELAALREKNSQLSSDVLKKADQLSRIEQSSVTSEKSVKDFQLRIKSLEKKIEVLELEKRRLTEEHEAVEVEREEELRAVQNALDDALEEKIKLQNKFDHDFEILRSSFSSQENQLMDDFEWKLRQIESACKKKLQDKDRQTEEKLKDVRNEISKELIDETERIRLEKIQVDEQMRQVCHFKSYEVELIQLRGLTHEQQKLMRSASRQIEHLKFSEKLARDDLRSLKNLLEKEKSNLTATQNSHQRRLEVQEENIHVQLGKQRNELTAKFEERIRAECSRLKQDLCKQHAEEKHLAVESMKLLKDQDLSSANQVWEKQRRDLVQEISKLKESLKEKESWHKRELEKLTAKSDSEKWELRRKMEKESTSHTELMTALKDTYKEELDSLREQYEIVADRLRNVEKKLVEAEEKHSEFTGCAESSEKLSPVPHKNPVNKSDSGCGDDASDEDEEDEDDDEEEEEEIENKLSPKSSEKSNNGNQVEEMVVHSLREEVATLQGSIEKLTSTLTTEGEPVKLCSKSSSESSSSSEIETPSGSESDDDE